MKGIALILMVCICCTSCNKESCWECDVNSAGVKFKETFCDLSKKEVAKKQDKIHETKDQTGTVIYTTTYSNCIRK